MFKVRIILTDEEEETWVFESVENNIDMITAEWLKDELDGIQWPYHGGLRTIESEVIES